MHKIVEVKDLSKQFSGITVVDRLSFSVYKGDVFGFLGQNGAGKSTTIRMLLSLIRPTGGQIKIFDKDLNDSRNEILSKVGAVIEKPDLYKYLNGLDNLSLFARLSGKSFTRKELSLKLGQVGLEDRGGDKVRTYSQGMKQRLGIAVALVHDPDLIILDEPTNGLDPQGIADIRNLIQMLSRDQQKTFLVSSHLLGEMEQIANRMLIIDKGKKIVEGAVRELVDPAKLVLEIETTDNIACRAKLETTNWDVHLRKSVYTDKLIMDIARDEIPLLVRQLVAMDVQVISLKPVNSLEEYFLSLTKEKIYVETGTN
jgi:ABC-type multidrug transport system ATPase subunit